MSDAANDLVPVFIPSLAALLAQAEATKGERLTEAAVVRLRDEAICMMMTREDAAKLSDSRGYRDVEPGNCWADWHRLRVQLTGDGCLPRLVLCVPGRDDLEASCGRILVAEGIEHEWGDRDDRMGRAFRASACRWDPSLAAEDLAAIDEHTRVLYVLGAPSTARDAPGVARRSLQLGRRLLEAGGLAVKCESSGIAHGRARWLELARAAEGDGAWSALLRGYVQWPIQDGDDYQTCGLHLLGQPDLIASESHLREAYGPAADPAWSAVDLFVAFASYLVTECAPGGFASGHTFSTDDGAPRFRVVWEECTGYESDDLFFNAFGRWRFVGP
jgi:hypothetical protein